MGVAIEAVTPTKVATRDSLELWVLLKSALKIRKVTHARNTPIIEAMGALIQMLRVASMFDRIKPVAPNAVMKHANTVGLKKEMPGTPLLSKPASAWPPVP